MPLRIITNLESSKHCEDHHPLAHLGTRDRDDPTNRFDHPSKACALLDAALRLERSSHESVAQSTDDTTIVIRQSNRAPTREQLLTAHTEEYIQALQEASLAALSLTDHEHGPFVHFGQEADVSPGTHRAACSSVGAAFDAIDTALAEEETTAFALVWPPGHHAEPSQAMGFCYFSTAALAALYARNHARQVRPACANRVAIIDIDHHRANGTAAVLANKEDLLLVDLVYRSPYNDRTQRYLDGAREYPYTKRDASLSIQPHPITVASNVISIEFEGTQHHHHIIERFIHEAMPRIRAFCPDVVLWSLGLDSAKGDPIGGLGLLPSSFYTFIKGMRVALPHAKHCGVLEGGYEKLLGGRCLRAALMAFHDPLLCSGSRTFKRYRSLLEQAHHPGRPYPDQS